MGKNFLPEMRLKEKCRERLYKSQIYEIMDIETGRDTKRQQY